jgi:hypothetical protein
LKEIGRKAFRNYGLKSIRIPNNVDKFGGYCFYSCKSLSRVTFESGSELKKIGGNAFWNSGLKSIRIPNNVEKIGDFCFWCCESLNQVTFESGSRLKEIGNVTFNYRSLKCVRIEEGFNMKYNWPKDCRIEYIPHSNDDEREKKLSRLCN